MRHVLTSLGAILALSGCALAMQPTSFSDKLHKDLRLTSDQEAAWGHYAAVMQDDGPIRARQAAEQMLPQLPTPRRLALIDAVMTQELAAYRRQSDAIQALYGRLSPDQQRIFDRETVPPEGAASPDP
jgi:hypothetical protein